MKKGIHPKNYRMVAFKDMSNEDVFLTRSTVNTKETLDVDGVEYPLFKIEISNFTKGYSTPSTSRVSFVFTVERVKNTSSFDISLNATIL